MHTWLIKTEPETWSWTQQIKVGNTHWDGVRNYQAQNYLKQMRKSDRAFFYHSGKERQIMGIVEIVKTFYPDPSDQDRRFGMVDVKTVASFPHPVPLVKIKGDPRLKHLALVRQPRLSVMPIDAETWGILCNWGGV